MSGKFDAKGEALQLHVWSACGFCRMDPPEPCKGQQRIEAALTKAEQAGFRRGVEEAAKVIVKMGLPIPPGISADLFAKIRKLGEK